MIARAFIYFLALSTRPFNKQGFYLNPKTFSSPLWQTHLHSLYNHNNAPTGQIDNWD